MTRTWMALGLAMLASGCVGDRWQFSDDVDFTLNFEPFELLFGNGPSDSLATPYVEGAAITVMVHDRRDRRDMAGWTLQSSDPAVFEIDDISLIGGDRVGLIGAGFAVGSGDAELELVDDAGEVVDTAPVQVRAPSRIELHFSGRLFTHRDDLPTEVVRPQVLVGGMGTYQARYFDGDTRLNGHGVLGVGAVGDLDVEVDQTYLWEDRDWLRLTPRSQGDHQLELLVGGEVLEVVTVRGVQADAVDHIELHGEDESAAHDEEWLVVLAESVAADGTPIQGVEYSWDVGGAPENGLGDLYRYTFDRSNPEDLVARFGGHESEVEIHTGGGFVDSSNHIGCSTVTGSAGLWGLLPALALFWRRRRR